MQGLVTSKPHNRAPAPGRFAHVDPARQARLLVVGNGMVGQRFCRQLEDLGLTQQFRITVVTEESRVAYDRVHLARVLGGEAPESLNLTEARWFEQAGIELHLGQAATFLDRAKRELHCRTRVFEYDRLVFATGSSPVLPKIEGLNAPRICVYRSLDDALRLRALAIVCRSRSQPVVIVGAGLLGVEAAESMQALGCRVTLLDAASHLLSRQLDLLAAKHLAQVLARAHFEVLTSVRLQQVISTDSGFLLKLGNGRTLSAGCIIVAAGVRPRDELARASGLNCDLFGGIVVDDALSTSDPAIFAIGECARHRGQTYGVVAPGYAMADALAARFANRSQIFQGASITTRLKVSKVDLTCVGESNVRDPSTRCVAYTEDGCLRQLVLRRGRVVGATSIGAWVGLPNVQQAVSTGQKVTRFQLRRFERTGELWPGQQVKLELWPDTATVCGCTGTTCGLLRAARARGAQTPASLSEATGAATVCGSCKPLLEIFCGGAASAPAPSRPLLALSLLALAVCLVALFGPRISYAESVQAAAPWDALWRNSVLKQVSGFTLLGVALLASTLSLRKRLKSFQVGSFAGWRTVHSSLGTLCLIGLAAHTGMRIGSNLDAALGLGFLTMTLVGSLAGLATVLERRFPGGQGVAFRVWLGRLHLWLLWPLPVLVVFHVVKVYFY